MCILSTPGIAWYFLLSKAWCGLPHCDGPWQTLRIQPCLVYWWCTSMTSSSRPSVSPHPPLRDYYQTEEQRRKLLDTQFDHVAPDYNWITQASCFGSGKRYRHEALKRSGLTEGNTILDIACGPEVISVCADNILSERLAKSSDSTTVSVWSPKQQSKASRRFYNARPNTSPFLTQSLTLSAWAMPFGMLWHQWKSKNLRTMIKHRR